MSRKEFLEQMEGLSIKDLHATIKDLQQDLFHKKMNNLAWSLEDNSQIRLTRKKIARAKTVLSRKLAQ